MTGCGGFSRLRTLLLVVVACSDWPTKGRAGFYVMNGPQLYSGLQTSTGNAVASIPSGQPWNQFNGRSDDGDPVRNYADFYTKYTNAYSGTAEWPASKGIPVLGSSKADDGALLRIRATVVAMLDKKPWRANPWDVRDKMLQYYSRVITRAHGELWSEHPEFPIGAEAGGANQEEPTTGCEASGLCYTDNNNSNWDRKPGSVCIEEFGHSIDQIAIVDISPQDINILAKQERIQCARGSSVWARAPGWDPVTAQNEYYASGFEYAYDNIPINDLYKLATNKNQLHQNDPVLFCMVAKYFDVSGTYCPIQSCQPGCEGECICASTLSGTLPNCPQVLGQLRCSSASMCSGSATISGSCDAIPGNFSCGAACGSSSAAVPSPSPAPTPGPTLLPTSNPSPGPTPAPAPNPTRTPTRAPTRQPTRAPTRFPTRAPSPAPVVGPTSAPVATAAPTLNPTLQPSQAPSVPPSHSPTASPTSSPTTPAPVLSNVELRVSSNSNPVLPPNLLSRTAVWANWDSQGNITQVLLAAVPTNPLLSIPLLITRSTSNSGTFRFNPRVVGFPAAGNYTVQIVHNADVKASSEPFYVDPCLLKSCANGGVCAQGRCQCTGLFTGESCQISPCDSVQCRNGACNSSTGLCQCSANYTGALCDVPPACGLMCAHGGTVQGNSSTQCASCTCAGQWTGSRCSTCSLACVRGSPAADCAQCNCPPRLTGTLCARVFVGLEIGPFTLSASAINADLSSFQTGFARDVADALNISTSRVVVFGARTTARGTLVTFRLLAGTDLPPSNASQPTPSSSAEHQITNFHPTLAQTQAEAEAELVSLVDQLKVVVANPNSALYQGLTTSALLPQLAEVSDADNSADTGSSGDNTVVVAAVGAVVALLVVAAGVAYWRRRNRSSARPKGGTSFPGHATSAAASSVGQLPSQYVASSQPAAHQWSNGGHGQAHQHSQVQLAASHNVTAPSATAYAPPANQTPMPGWVQYETDDGTPYFYNEQTNESRWEL